MKKTFFCALLMSQILSGCTSNNTPVTTKQITAENSVAVAKPVEPVANGKQDDRSHLTQCNRDLESLRTVSQTTYRRYLAEYDGLMKSSAGFMTVKDDVSPEVAELARPKFQFALVNLCYRIKDALAQTLINQAGGC